MISVSDLGALAVGMLRRGPDACDGKVLAAAAERISGRSLAEAAERVHGESAFVYRQVSEPPSYTLTRHMHMRSTC